MNSLFLISLLLVVGTSHCQVFQPRFINVMEGDPVIIPCQQNATNKETMFWYKKPLDGRFEFLASGFDDTKQAGTFTMTIESNKRSTSLNRSRAEPGDAATYYCAVRDTVVSAGRAAAQKLKTFTAHKFWPRKGNI
ncbi:hypothetical protein FKM82_023001, partial [Ascaphus truei]